jgi:hypothetical protein
MNPSTNGATLQNPSRIRALTKEPRRRGLLFRFPREPQGVSPLISQCYFLSRRNIGNKLSVEFAPGRIIR